MTTPEPSARQWQSHASADTRQAWQDGYNRGHADGIAAEREAIRQLLAEPDSTWHFTSPALGYFAVLLGDTGSRRTHHEKATEDHPAARAGRRHDY